VNNDIQSGLNITISVHSGNETLLQNKYAQRHILSDDVIPSY